MTDVIDFPTEPTGDLPERYFDPAMMSLLAHVPFQDRERTRRLRAQGRRDPEYVEEAAMHLHLKGCTLNQIAKELSCTDTHVLRLIDRAKERRRPLLDRKFQEYVEEQLMQIETLMAEHWPFASHPEHGEILIRCMDRKAKLLGLDKPTKLEMLTPPPPLEIEFDMSLLTVDELKQMRQLIATAQERAKPIEGQVQAALPAPSKPEA